MKISKELLRQIEADLCLNVPFVRGQNIPVNNCWHFSTDGNTVELMFYDVADFIAGMNRIYVVLKKYNVVILAFCLMDTHVHFVLYGSFEECNRFVHDYVNRTSQYIFFRHGERNRLKEIQISHQQVDTDYYLKTVICYTLKNPVVAGLPFMAYDYPWSSCALYFRNTGLWTSIENSDDSKAVANTRRSIKEMLRTNENICPELTMSGGIISPREYTAVPVVERIFKTCKGFSYFMERSREDDVESRGGYISHLSIPIQEMRQYKNELCMELFGARTLAGLNTQQRFRLAKTLRTRYNCSPKQVSRLCGLVYDEVKSKL